MRTLARLKTGFCLLLVSIGKLEMVAGISLLFLIVACIGVQIISRYVFDYPIIWVEEISVYAFIWGVFIGASVGMKYNRHISIAWLSHKASPRVRTVISMISQVVILALVILILPAAWRVMRIEGQSMTTALPIQFPRHLFYSVPFFTGMALMGLTTVYYLLASMLALLSGTQVEPILVAEKDQDKFSDAERAMQRGKS